MTSDAPAENSDCSVNRTLRRVSGSISFRASSIFSARSRQSSVKSVTSSIRAASNTVYSTSTKVFRASLSSPAIQLCSASSVMRPVMSSPSRQTKCPLRTCHVMASCCRIPTESASTTV